MGDQDQSNGDQSTGDNDKEAEVTISPVAEESIPFTVEQLQADGYELEPDEDPTPNA